MSIPGVSILSYLPVNKISQALNFYTEPPHTYHNNSSEQLNHLEWLLNGTVFMNGTVGATILQLLIRPIMLSHAGLWECRAVFSDGSVSPSANAGILTVYGEYTERLVDILLYHACL